MWLFIGAKVARLVGEGAAVVVRPDAVRRVVAHGVRLLRSWGEGVAVGVACLLVICCQGCRHGSREKKRKEGKERKGNKKGSGVPLPEPL